MADYEKQAREWRTREYIRQFRECKFPSGEVEALAALLESVARDARAEERENLACFVRKRLGYYRTVEAVGEMVACEAIWDGIRAAGETEKGAGE